MPSSNPLFKAWCEGILLGTITMPSRLWYHYFNTLWYYVVNQSTPNLLNVCMIWRWSSYIFSLVIAKAKTVTVPYLYLYSVSMSKRLNVIKKYNHSLFSTLCSRISNCNAVVTPLRKAASYSHFRDLRWYVANLWQIRHLRSSTW